MPGGAFVGRERQLDMLLQGLEDARSGRGRLFLIGGEPGIGKSRLAEEFATVAAERESRVVWGRSWEAGGAPAYWPWTQALRGLVGDLGTKELRSVVGGGAPRLAQILPELRERLGVVDPPSTSPESARFDLFVAVGDLLRNASREQPHVLLLEDLHAADAPSLLLLRFVAEGSSERRVVIVATYRDIELTADHPMTPAISELLRAQGADRVALGALGKDDVARLIETISNHQPSAGLVASVHERTEGNPLFVGEFVRLIDADDRLAEGAGDRWGIPVGVHGVIARRLEGLPEGCRELLKAASVIGREFSLNVLERVRDLPASTVAETLHDAVTSRLVEEVHDGAGGLRFSHSLIRDTIYEELLPADRQSLHAQVAEVLENAYAADPESYVAELAHHFSAAGPRVDRATTVSYVIAAGRRAVESLAYEEAVRLFQMALRSLQESPDDATRCEVLVLLGDAQARAGDQPASKDTFEAAAALATRIDDHRLLGRAALGYAGRFPWLRAGDDTRLIPLLRQALEVLPREDDPLRARLLARLAGALRDQASVEPRSALAEEAVAVARRIGDPETLMYALLGWWSAALMGPDELDRQLVLAEEVDRLAGQIGDREMRLNVVWVRYLASLTRGQIWEARQQHEQLSQLAEELRQPSQRWYDFMLSTVLALQEGRFDEAEAQIEDTLALGHQAQAWDAQATRLFALFTLRREQGRLGEIEEDLRRAATTHAGYRSIRGMLLTLLVEDGRLDEARGLFEQLAANGFADFPKDSEYLFALTLLAEAAAALGDERRATVLEELLAPYGDLVALAAAEVSLGPVARALGLLASTRGRREEATRRFESAIELSGRMGARPWVAHSEYALAAMLGGGDDRERSRAAELATRARDAAEEMGMTALRSRVTELLSGLGTAAPSAGGPLTPREREVAGLIVEGLTNREIAERLYVSERTAETHVQNILTKLGFTARAQVAAWAVRQGLGGTT